MGLSNYKKLCVENVARTRWKIRTQFQLQTRKGNANLRDHRRTLENNVKMALGKTVSDEMASWYGAVEVLLWTRKSTFWFLKKGEQFNGHEKPIQSSDAEFCRSKLGYMPWKAFLNFHQHATIITNCDTRAENTALQSENKSLCFSRNLATTV